MVDESNAAVAGRRHPIYGASFAGDRNSSGRGGMLATAAESLHCFDYHPEAKRVARWAHELVEL